MDAVLSAIVVTPGSCKQVTALLHRLRQQTIREKIEIVFVTTSLAELQPDQESLSVFSCWKVVALDRLMSMASARAAGVRAASCPYVVFTEQHCFPDDTWAEEILDAFENHAADVVGPVVGNANPKLALSWANLCTEYGHWMAPQPGGLVDHLPGHNSAYRRSLLLDLADGLERGLESEYAMQLRWREQGRRLWLQPAARVHHVNITYLRAHLAAACAFQRPWANSRAMRWSWPRRSVYALAWPLIAAVRLRRVVADIVRTGKGGLLPRILPMVAIGLLASAFGEFLGYLGSVGNADAVLMEVELYRERFLASNDAEALALFR